MPTNYTLLGWNPQNKITLYREDLKIIFEQFIQTDTTFVQRKDDDAILLGGWNWSREHGKPVPFEWIKFPPGIAWRDNPDVLDYLEREGLEPVYRSSVEMLEVYEYLLRYMYELNKNEAKVWLYNREAIITKDEYYYWGPYNYTDLMYFGGVIERFTNPDPVKDHSKSGETMLPQSNKTLLQLIRKIKKDWNKLIKNDNAYTWVWLNQRLKDVGVRNYAKNPFKMTAHKERCKKLLEKTTGVTWEQTTIGRWYPTSMLNAYWTYGTKQLPVLTWIKPKDFEHKKTTGGIVWCSYYKDWVSNILFANVTDIVNPNIKPYNEKTKLVLKKVAKIKTFNTDWILCTSCHTTYNKNFFITIEEYSKDICCKCASELRNGNEVPTIDNIYQNYHAHHNGKWLYIYNRLPKESKKEMCYGLEVEMQNKNGKTSSANTNTCWAIYQAQLQLDPNLNACYFERDGSLADGGIEMVTNPMSLGFHKYYWEHMLPVLRSHCVGWNTDKINGSAPENNNYGIHITFSRKFWTDYQIARLIKFVENQENKLFIRGLAQRMQVYSGDNLADKSKKLKEVVKISQGKLGGSLNRYTPVNVKENLVELRFFRTTLNSESFMKNIEFIDAFYQWIKTTGYSHRVEDFISWMLSQKTMHYRWNNLFSYFSREKLPVKFKSPIINPWMEAFKTRKKEQFVLFEQENTKVTNEELLDKDLDLCV